MVYFLGRDIRVGLSTEQANYGIEHTNGTIAITNTSSNPKGATDVDFIPRRGGTVKETSTITAVSTNIAQYASTASNNRYVLVYDTGGKKYLIWFDHDGNGVKPANIGEDYNQEVDLSAISANATNIAGAIQTQTAADSDFAAAFTITQSGAVVTIVDKDTGSATDIVRGSGYANSDLTVATTVEGTGVDVDVALVGNDELRIDDVVGVDFTFGAMDEDIAYMGQRTALKAEIKKEITVTITKKKSNNAFSLLFNQARCGIRATDGSTNFGGGSDNVAFDSNLDQPFADANGSGFGFRVYLELKAGSEVLTLPNCCITEYSVTLNPDAVQEETITFYSNVAPVIGTAVNATTTASTAF
tara:strand:- start:2136 stop:3209 length:1074 start_codon:yes stop_codon:yes gene_type:complete